MLKKFGFFSTLTGIVAFIFGFWMLESSGSYWGYSSGMRTLMEFAPWFFIILGVFGIIAGVFYLIQNMKPISRGRATVIEKNGPAVVLEFENGSRKTLTVYGSIPLIVGDTGTVGYKGHFIVEFNK